MVFGAEVGDASVEGALRERDVYSHVEPDSKHRLAVKFSSSTKGRKGFQTDARAPARKNRQEEGKVCS